MRNSMMIFDTGAWAEAKRLAVTVRTLVHNPPESKSKSLMSLLGIDDVVKVLSFGAVQETAGSYEALLSLRCETLKNGIKVSKIPFGSDRLNHENTTMLDLENWWNEPVVKDSNHTISTRKDIVLLLANREGGAHADYISKKEINTSSGENLGWNAIYDGQEFPIYLPPHLPTMRAIAQELYMSLKFKLNTGLLDDLRNSTSKGIRD